VKEKEKSIDKDKFYYNTNNNRDKTRLY
jgi:hypothetical protein